MKSMALNAVTDLKYYLFCFKKGYKDNIRKQFNFPLIRLP